MASTTTSTIVRDGKAAELFKKYCQDFSCRALDLGSGKGKFAAALKEYNILGTDKDTDDLNKKLNYANEIFSVVTAWNVVEHLDNPWNAVSEIKRILKPGGIFIFSIPNSLNLKNRFCFLFKGEMYRYACKNGHKVIFTKKTLGDFLEGFEVLEKGFQRITLPFIIRIPILRRFISKNELTGITAYFVLKKPL